MEQVQQSINKFMNNLKENEKEIMIKPIYYMHKTNKTDALPIVTFAFNEWLNVPQEKLDKVVEITKLMRDAAILIDDIQDNSMRRDGVPVAYRVYGTSTTLNSVGFGYFLAMKKAAELHPDAGRICSEEMIHFHTGQEIENDWRGNGKCPTEAQYREMAITKTSCFVTLSARLLQLFSTNKKDLIEFGLLLGFYMQVKNDYCNLMCSKCSGENVFCEDLTEGKFSFPITHAINQKTENSRKVLDIVKLKTADNNIKKECIDMMIELGSFSYSKAMIISLYDQLQRMIKELGPNDQMTAMLNDLHKCHLVL